MESAANGRLPPEKRRVVILGNPRAGTGNSRRRVERLCGALRGRGLEPILCWQREELGQLARESDTRCVVAAGGDGTLLEVVNRVPHLPIALFPLGNENLVARFCGVPRRPDILAERIARGTVRQLDLARCNERLFSLMVSAGIDAEVVHRVHGRRTGHINKLSYLLPTLEAFAWYRYPTIEVELQETGERLRGAMVFVFNIPQYALRLPLPLHSQADDGRLDVYVFERPGMANLARYLEAIVRRRHGHLPDHHHRRVQRACLSAAEQVPVQTDGDPAGFLPVQVEIVPAALTLIG